MRIAPLEFLLDPAKRADLLVIRDVCRITHHSDEACSGALAVIAAIRAACSGNCDFLAAAIAAVPDSSVRDRMQALLPLQEPCVEIARRFGATGHVVDAIPFALYCAQSIRTETLADLLAKAIEAGGDTDTIASIAGLVAGTFVGADQVPRVSVEAIEERSELMAIASSFADFCKRCT